MSARPFPTLRTQRLELQIPDPGLADLMADYSSRNREHLAPWEPRRPEGFHTPAGWRETLAQARDLYLNDHAVRLAILSREQSEPRVVGTVALNEIVRGAFQAAYLGYGIDRELQGKGYMYEAMQAVLAFAFGELGLHRVMANYVPTNERSKRLLKRLGFVEEGFAPRYLRINGQWRDHVLTALVNPHES